MNGALTLRPIFYNCVAIAALQGARVYGVDINEDKFEHAKAVGATNCSSNLDEFSDVVFDVIIDFAGAGSTTTAAISTVKLGGRVILVGWELQRFGLPQLRWLLGTLSCEGQLARAWMNIFGVWI